MPRNLLRATNFAHLVGLGRPASGKPSAEDEEEDKDRKDAKRAEESDKEPEDDKDNDPKALDDDDAEGDPEEEPKGKRGKKAKRADDDSDDAEMSEGDDEDEDDKKDERDAKATAARKRERARCAAIFSDKAAAKNPALAATLAFDTDLTRSAAVKVLRAGGVSAQAGLNARMSGLAGIRPGAEGGAPSRKQVAATSWDAAATRAGIKPRG